MIAADELREGVVQEFQAAGQDIFGRRPDVAGGDERKPVAVMVDHAVAGGPQARVNTENYH
jgi:hypothetical protein